VRKPLLRADFGGELHIVKSLCISTVRIRKFGQERRTASVRGEIEEIMVLFRWNVRIAFLVTAIYVGSSASAQQDASSSAQAVAAWSPAQSTGVFAFPKTSQTADQQMKDESDCYGMAKQRTGLDPQKPAPAGPSAEQVQAAQNEAAQNADQVKGARVGGAARGAVGGAAIGAIAGTAGKGAGAGVMSVPTKN
jgi:hypothetical protein